MRTRRGDEHAVVVHKIPRDDLRRTVEDAWRSFAPARALKAFDAAQAERARLPAVKQDDVRRVVASLPGAVEGPIWGSDLGFLVGTEKRTRFARFGPPVGSGISRLLPPDDEDTLVLLRCEQRPLLLASRPDRWFTTAHYGDPDEPGGVITRLREHRGADELAELAELIEDSWREVAPPDLIAQLDLERDGC